MKSTTTKKASLSKENKFVFIVLASATLIAVVLDLCGIVK